MGGWGRGGENDGWEAYSRIQPVRRGHHGFRNRVSVVVCA